MLDAIRPDDIVAVPTRHAVGKLKYENERKDQRSGIRYKIKNELTKDGGT